MGLNCRLQSMTHNGMVIDLLRKGHTGPIISAVTVRQNADLGYSDKHRELEDRYPNYHYMPMPTREEGIPKRYLQDLLRDNDFSEKLGVTLSPDTSHIFLCGNPDMISAVKAFLAARGFTPDHGKQSGTVHVEEYW